MKKRIWIIFHRSGSYMGYGKRVYVKQGVNWIGFTKPRIEEKGDVTNFYNDRGNCIGIGNKNSRHRDQLTSRMIEL